MSVKKTDMKASAPVIRRNGFTLLEVLVALLVLSIGLLGIGKLVMLSARANDSAYMRSQATALAYTILDAMRANRGAALVGTYDIAVGPGPAPVTCTAAAPCNSTVQAQNDLNLWKNALTTALPAGDGSVTTATVPDPGSGVSNVTVFVTVQWNDTVAQQVLGGPPAASVVLQSIL
jgi:type IV pilus assembly protein PilV